jgi:thiol-disulfide isomerase/thioredoxin
MRRFYSLLLLSVSVLMVSAHGQQPSQAAAAPTAIASPPAGTGARPSQGPTDPKAQKTFDDALKLFQKRDYAFALDEFRKADKQDGGKCTACEIKAYQAADKAQNYKAAREETDLLLAHLPEPVSQAQLHYLAGETCLTEGVQLNRDKAFEQANSEFQAALKIQPDKSDCLYADGIALSHLKQDGDAKERFEQYLKLAKPDNVNYARAQRFAEHPEMARARVAPNFRLTALDGQTITLEGLTGKVVLIDFWATWCPSCREALPHMREIARKFAGQPFVILSISLDSDEAKWKDFVAHNDMTWIQYRDNHSESSIAKIFGVTAIPATFTIDADGILQDQHVGDADMEGKIKKLVARAQEVASKKTVAELRP